MLSINAETPVQSLVGAFAAWKTLLLAIALGSGVGPAYDTSTTLLHPSTASPTESAFDLATKLTRWDALYFVQSARRGYLFEQEWAFAIGPPALISNLATLLESFGIPARGALEPLLGVFISHVSHLLSVLALYYLALRLVGNQRRALTAALLHVFSPAGLFLSAPYAESTFSLLSFLGYLFYAKGALADNRRLGHDVSLVAAGLWFGFANVFRSNGLLNGLLFAVDLARELSASPSLSSIRKRIALMIGGSAVAIGFLAPQVAAYATYCSGPSPRPWCSKTLPSIYSFVQEKHWNVGFLRYWTLPNVPLFLLAAPVVYLMIASGSQSVQTPASLLAGSTVASTPARHSLLRSIGLAQLVLAVFAITNYHVQIITRISTAYPVLYIWLAGLLAEDKTSRFGRAVVVFMVAYAAIQGALFASFLPPA